jgi:S-adenosylmethionine-diacylglycerol 3-amino-3-carboxypropyl transferase
MAHPIKFAVVREDAEVECALLADLPGAREALVVASGGCTALRLGQRFPALHVTAFDHSAAQLGHVRDKLSASLRHDFDALDLLNERGEFEGLFRVLRRFLAEFVWEEGEVARYFDGDPEPEAIVARWFTSRYWPAAFAVAFGGEFLRAMFGPAATQHAAPGSYPAYFRGAFERGLAAPSGHRNPFLQHCLLGAYRDVDRPPAQRLDRTPELTLVEGTLLDVPDLSRFALLSLSNVFDWSDDDLVAAWAARLRAECAPGAVVLLRQLNNTRDLRRFFAPAFAFDDARGEAMLQRERSLFYNRVEVAVRA